MKITLDNGGAGYQIHSHGPGRVCVARVEIGADGAPLRREHVLRANAIISPEALVENWVPGAVDALSADSLSAGLALDPEVLLLGCGAGQPRPLPLLARAINARGVGFELMSTAAACRTYNVLMLEGRRVVAALYI